MICCLGLGREHTVCYFTERLPANICETGTAKLGTINQNEELRDAKMVI